jgi:hypothetical protein
MKTTERLCMLAMLVASQCGAQVYAQQTVEAESVAGGTVISDADASNQQAVTRTTTGIYTWWQLADNAVPNGDYVMFARIRSLDGASHSVGDEVFADNNQIATLQATVTSPAYHWYRLGEYSFAGTSLRMADWSDPNMAFDKLIIEPVQTVNAATVSGGTVISDPNAISGSAVTRTTGGIYTWWTPNATPLLHGNYTVYARIRTQGSAPATFTEYASVNGTQSTGMTVTVNSSTYAWVPVGDFSYTGSSLTIADYSDPGLVVDQIRLVQDKPLDPTLSLYHYWYGNTDMAGVTTQPAAPIAGGTVSNDSAASDGQSVTRSSTGIYLWWNVPTAVLVPGALYSVDVRMRSVDGQSHNYGLIATSQSQTIGSQNVAVSSTSYQWYKAISTVTYGSNGLVLADWSDPGLAVDSIRLQLVSPQPSTYQQIGFYPQGSPGTPGLTTEPGRFSVISNGSGQLYGYFRQDVSSSTAQEYMGISSDSGATFAVQPSPIISITPNPTVPGFGSLTTAYDAAPYKTSNGYYLVFEGAGSHPFSSLLAYSPDGVNNWTVQGALVTPLDYNSSASTPNVVQDVNTQALYLQWVDVDATNSVTSRHQASMNYLQTWNSNATWPAAAAIWQDPTYGQLPQSPAGSWNANNNGAGNVLYEDGYYYMVAEGANEYNCTGDWGIGIARVDEGSLSNPSAWVQSSNNPMLKAFDTGSCWMGYPQLVKIGNTYYMYYSDPQVNYTPTNTNQIYRRSIMAASH